MKLALSSEFGTLRRVIMHRPGMEIERLTPQNSSELLFEDVPYLESMQKEHDEFSYLLKDATDAKVYRLKQLLQEVIRDEKHKAEILDEALARVNHKDIRDDLMAAYSTAEVVNMLIAGIRVEEIQKKLPAFKYPELQEGSYLIYPSPNLYFMRDPAAVIQHGVISSHMKYSGRQFESNLLRMVFKYHDDFKEDFNEVFPVKVKQKKIPTIEGGDVIVLSPRVLAIGCSERTESAAIQQVAKKILSEGCVERVYEVKLPGKRNYMHLDTVFSIIDENLVIAYSEAIDALFETYLYRLGKFDENNEVILNKELIRNSLIKILKNEIPSLEIVETGYGLPDFASREQWYDGANVFALGPRRVVSYNRNKHTNRALRDMGVEVLEISSSELSRGLGGPRCMTMPLERDEI